MKNEVKCNQCEWEGVETELEIFEDEGGFFKGCPNCKTDGYLIDVEKNEFPNTIKISTQSLI